MTIHGRGLGWLLGLGLATVVGGAALVLAPRPRARLTLRGDDDEDGDELPTLVSVKTIDKHKLAARAQKVYDEWDADSDPEDGDPEVGFGGICHLIADEIVDELDKQGAAATSHHCTVGENHVFVIGQFTEGIYEIDIPPGTYESGGGYNWQKKQGVTIEPEDISFERLSRDPRDFDQYTEEG